MFTGTSLPKVGQQTIGILLTSGLAGTIEDEILKGHTD
jgi:hypothetical protein